MSNAQRDRAKERLCAKYPFETKGTWVVKGEASNADMAGPHIMPTLGYFSGKYVDVIEYALDMNGFFAWGAGGSVEAIKVEPITQSKTKQLKDAKRELSKVKQREDELNKQIEWLTLGGTTQEVEAQHEKYERSGYNVEVQR